MSRLNLLLITLILSVVALQGCSSTQAALATKSFVDDYCELNAETRKLFQLKMNNILNGNDIMIACMSDHNKKIKATEVGTDRKSVV